jgi:hypothetical protein
MAADEIRRATLGAATGSGVGAPPSPLSMGQGGGGGDGGGGQGAGGPFGLGVAGQSGPPSPRGQLRSLLSLRSDRG